MQEPITLGFDLPPSQGRSTPTSFLLDAVRRRESGAQALSALTVLLFIGGILLFMFPLLTDFYTNGQLQPQLAEDFERFQQEFTNFDDFAKQVAENDGVAVTKIVMEDIGIETLVVEGTDPGALRAGAGHYADTPLAGQNGNVAIAGHRTTYGKPFNRLDELDVGDSIWLIAPYGDFRYEVSGDPPSDVCDQSAVRKERKTAGACVTLPSDWEVVSAPSDMSRSLLTLTTCHPKGSAARRLIIQAELVESLPPGTYDARNG